MKSLLILIVVCITATFGYIANIVKLTKCDFCPSYKAEAIRITGIVVPFVGTVAGFLTIEDVKSK